jgi:hypothetical protein
LETPEMKTVTNCHELKMMSADSRSSK